MHFTEFFGHFPFLIYIFKRRSISVIFGIHLGVPRVDVCITNMNIHTLGHFSNSFLKCQIKSKRLFFELIKNGSMSDRAMDRWMPDFPTLVLDFQKEIIELAAESLQFEK